MDCANVLLSTASTLAQEALNRYGLYPTGEGGVFYLDPEVSKELSRLNYSAGGFFTAETWDRLGVNGRAALYRLVRNYEDAQAFFTFHRARRMQARQKGDQGDAGSGYLDRLTACVAGMVKQLAWLERVC